MEKSDAPLKIERKGSKSNFNKIDDNIRDKGSKKVYNS